jgi:hypothetical protein
VLDVGIEEALREKASSETRPKIEMRRASDASHMLHLALQPNPRRTHLRVSGYN